MKQMLGFQETQQVIRKKLQSLALSLLVDTFLWRAERVERAVSFIPFTEIKQLN